MTKPNKSHILLLIILAAALIVIISCAKPECKTSADCSPRTCFLSKCEDKKCTYALQRNCCGNRINESIENGKPGNQCTCPADYGKCEGKGRIAIGSRTEDATYVSYSCNADEQCVLGVDESRIAPLNFLDQMNPGFLKASSVIKYNKPFDPASDSFEFKVTLDDIGKDVMLPVRLTKIKLLYSGGGYARAELLIAEKDLDGILNGIGDHSTLDVPLTLSYRPQELEEQGSLRYSIDYTYVRQVPSGKTANGTSIYNNETKRETFTAPVKPVFFFRSG
ncbi:hypothetical protein HYX04_05440 [Candidatus Woesearchaeota archaeon]|nr:hypothetical protein [Candidatus Woesearchaeota archaeon]